MSWFAELIPQPHTRGPLNFHSLLHSILVPTICYYTSAVLVIVPNTFIIRLALLPLTLWVTFRGATRVDLALGFDERLNYLNHGLLLVHTTLAMRVIVWTFRREPYKRRKTQISSTNESSWILSAGPKEIVIDAFDLCCNLRGCGWDWSQGLHVPPETRSTTSTTAFAVETFVSFILHLIIFDSLHYSVQWFAPSTVGSPIGGTIFDSTIPPLRRYLRSTIMSFLSGLTVYSAIQTCYLLSSLFGILLFQQDTSLWPPVFWSPWLSTSLTECWAKRWHQLFRDNFIFLGGKPLSLLAGRVGGVLGAFLVSGILHDFGVWGMGRGSDFQKVGGFFVMMGVGILLEHIWRKITGRRVGGYFGRIWTLAWVIGWGNIIVDAWAKKGLIGSVFLPQDFRLAQFIFGPLPFNTR